MIRSGAVFGIHQSPHKKNSALPGRTPPRWKLASVLVFVGALACNPGSAMAQALGDKPITLVVPFVPGGAVDSSARLTAEALHKVMGNDIIVENRPGAAGNIGYSFVARAPMDGHTVLYGYSATTACSPALYKDLAWDPVKDLVPVGAVAGSSLIVVVNPILPVNTLPELVAYLKAHPGEVSYGTSGIGSLAHIGSELFQKLTGTEMVHVPYKGSGEVIPDFLSGTIQFALLGAPAIKQHVEAGKLKALAVTSPNRDSTMPDIPTALEQGVEGLNVEGWMGLFVPADTPSEAAQAISDGLAKATEDTEFHAKIAAVGLQTQYLSPQAMAEKVQQDIDQCGRTIQESGIQIQ